MVFPGFSLYNKKAALWILIENSCPESRYSVMEERRSFMKKEKKLIVEPLVWRLSHRTIGEPGILEKTEICTKDRLERFPES